MNEWLISLGDWLAQGSDCVLITVLGVIGSTPREIGASMVVRLDTDQSCQSVGTIGGGHLEWQSLQIAQTLLRQSKQAITIERFNLGARLGQCCGGRVWVVFETINAMKAECWRYLVNCSQQGQILYRYLSSQATQSQWQCEQPFCAQFTQTQLITTTGSVAKLTENTDWQFYQVIDSTRFHVYLFGAGHIAQYLVRLLLPLSVRVHWVETRNYQTMIGGIDFHHPKLDYQETDIPEQIIDTALPNSAFIIMTHDHGLDFQLCQVLLKRQAKQADIQYFGMIGSHTKRQNFERRLLARGVSPQLLDTLVCPMGIKGINSKEPIVIAIAIVAELLQNQWDAQSR